MKGMIKPILVTLILILVCGGLLAICSNLLAVPEQERIQRAINKIYDEESVEMVDTLDCTTVDMSDFESVGTIKACYKLNNGDYLVLSTGKKGYSNGKITVYVSISQQNQVNKVVYENDNGQTLMSKLTNIYEKYIGKNKDSVYDVNQVKTGATMSLNAISNAVKTALEFVARLGG